MEKYQQFLSSPSFLLIGRDMPETCRKQILIKHLDPSKIVVIFPQTEFRVEKVIKKVTHDMSSEKGDRWVSKKDKV